MNWTKREIRNEAIKNCVLLDDKLEEIGSFQLVIFYIINIQGSDFSYVTNVFFLIVFILISL